jgi:NADH dehydrogenase
LPVSAGARHRIVVVGSGFGGLFATRFLRRAPVDVRLIDRTNHHLFQPLLYQVATGILSEGQIAPATRDILHRQANLTVELGEVTGFDLEQRLVLTTRPGGQSDAVPYDSLVVAAGVGQSYFGHDEFRPFAPGIKTLADALELRMRIFGALERAELEEDPVLRAEWLSFVAVGGGPTGVEISGQIAELSRRALDRNFRRFDPSEIRVLLFDGGDEILATFGDRLSERGTRELRKTGVEIHTRSVVVGVDEHGVDVKGADGTVTRYPARTKIWAAGVAASPLARLLADASGAECDRAGRIQVEPDCSIPGHPEVFAVGDMMALNGLPGVAEVAMQTGIHAARTITRRLDGKEPAPFRYRDLGSMAVISRRKAIVSFRGLRVSGFLGWLMWLVVHLTFMTGFKNRFLTIFYWLFSFIGHGRTERALLPLADGHPAAGGTTSVEPAVLTEPTRSTQ